MAGEQPVSVGSTIPTTPLAVVNAGVPVPAPIAVAPVGVQDTPPVKIEDAPKVFTQEQLTAIIKERLEKAESAVTERILKSLGVDSLDTVKAAVKATKEADEASKTELQKLQDKVNAALAGQQAAEARVAAFEHKEKIGTRNTAISKALTAASATNADDLLILLEAKSKELVDATLTAEGKVDDKAIAALLAKAQAEYANSFAPKAPGSPSNARGKAPSVEDARNRAANATTRLARTVFGS